MSAVLVLPALLAGCGSGVDVATPELSAADAETCAALVDSLPDTLAGEERRDIDSADAPGAAWGDPPLVLTCGVDRPAEWQPDAACTDMGGVGWFVPEEQLTDPSAAVTATALTHTPYVSLVVPARYRSQGIDAALTELAGPLREHLEAGDPCV